MILDDVFYLMAMDETPLRALPLSAEWKLEDMQDSTNRLEVRFPISEAGQIVTDQDIVFHGRRYSILSLGYDKDTSALILTCEELQARLVDVNLPTFKLSKETLPVALGKALAKTAGWTAGDVFENTLSYNAELKNVSTLFALRFLERQSGGRLFFDSGKKIVHIRKGDETIADVAFRYGKNVANITKEQTSPQATVLYAYGRDGMTIEALTGGKKYVEDFSWYTKLGMTLEDARKKFTKELVWEDDRYIYNATLHRDAVTRLKVLSQPQINYKLSNARADGLSLGSLAYVHDEELNIRVRVAVVKIIQSSNPEENELELDYIPPSLGATIDNTYSGDTNTGGSGVMSFFLQKNQAAVAVNNIPKAVVEADITVYSSTAFEMGLTLIAEVTGAGLLEGYFTLDGERLPVEIKQTVGVGWYTIGLPFIVSGIQEGTKTIRFFLTMASGAATIPAEKAEFFIKATGVYGGESNAKPDQTIIEDVDIIAPATPVITENTIQFIDLPRRFELIETVNVQVPSGPQLIEEAHDIYLDPPPVPVAPPARLSDTQIRSEFADMSYYSQQTRPTQTQADYFIDVAHGNAARYMIMADHFTVYVFATKGTFLNVEFPTEGNPIITSDDFIYYSFGANDTNGGKIVDWSINNKYPKSIVEVYEVPPKILPGEPGPPRRVQYATEYNMTETDLAPAAGTTGRISLTPIEKVGRTYQITRAEASEVFATAFLTQAPLFDGTTETIVLEYLLEDPALLVKERTAPEGSTHVAIFESGPVLHDITIREIKPAEVQVTKTITVASNGGNVGNIQRTAEGTIQTSDMFATQFAAVNLAGSGYIRDISVWNRSSSGTSAFKILLVADTNGSPDLTRKLYESDVIPVTTALEKFTVTQLQGIPIVDNAVYWIIASGRGLGSGSYMTQGTTVDSSIPYMKYTNGENSWAQHSARLAYEVTIGTL